MWAVMERMVAAGAKVEKRMAARGEVERPSATKEARENHEVLVFLAGHGDLRV